MHASTATFHLHKGGGVPADYEDASACRPVVLADEEVPGDQLRVAVSDGASESMLAGRWARLLVEEFVRAEPPRDEHDFATTAVRAAAHWPAVRAEYVGEREAENRPIRWYEKPGLARGAHATLLTARFTDGAARTWAAVALGDSCLFLVREERVRTAFPVRAAADFGVRPDLLGSRDPDDGLIASRADLITGDWHEGDQFFLCTDALAAWFLADHESGGSPWKVLRDLDTEAAREGFGDLVSRLRAEDRMRNDDVTLVRVDMW